MKKDKGLDYDICATCKVSCRSMQTTVNRHGMVVHKYCPRKSPKRSTTVERKRKIHYDRKTERGGYDDVKQAIRLLNEKQRRLV